MKILFKNSIKELHISKNKPIPNTLGMQNKKQNKKNPQNNKNKTKLNQNPRKAYSQSQPQKHKENIGIPTVLRTVRNLLMCQTKVTSEQKNVLIGTVSKMATLVRIP